jgi:amiloride-sensitive sodium channel
MHMPSTSPEVVEYGFAFSPGTENFMTIKAEVIHASDKIHSIHHEKRACFIDGERPLRFYEHYAFLNCMMECKSNHTFHVSKM